MALQKSNVTDICAACAHAATVLSTLQQLTELQVSDDGAASYGLDLTHSEWYKEALSMAEVTDPQPALLPS